MLLDAKDRKLLNYLLQSKNKWEINYLCQKLNFSRSNFNYHLEHINNLLCKNNLNPISLKQRENFQVDKVRSFYENIVKKDSAIFLNSNERKLVLIVLLLFNKQLTLKNITKILEVSVNSIFNDIEALKKDEYIKHLQIEFYINKQGYAITGNTFNLHKLLINTIIEITEIDHDKSILYF
ncbi:hypothetical protein SCLARK_001374 [Spiroplasma clarkii]|nr:hypothetical protein [Spiroplasma clarkii]ARU91901.1 hypothetical protein SCLARK_001374 [Spiroplasma clarkii]